MDGRQGGNGQWLEIRKTAARTCLVAIAHYHVVAGVWWMAAGSQCSGRRVEILAPPGKRQEDCNKQSFMLYGASLRHGQSDMISAAAAGNKKRGYNQNDCNPFSKFGAEEKTRTSTREPPLDPEPSASTNSATSATRMNMLGRRFFVKNFFGP